MNNDWITRELNNVAIRDDRIVKRLIKTTRTLYEYPHCSIPEACGSIAEAKAIYRLFDNSKVNSEVILMSHRQQTIERMKKYDIVLSIQDTTSLDYSTHPNTEGLGLYTTSQKAIGLLNHTALAVTVSGLPLGVLSRQVWTRNPQEHGKSYKRYKYSTEQKETQKWLNALDSSLEGIPEGIKVVTVCDREADVYDFFDKAVSQGRHLLVRAYQNRRVIGEEKYLLPYIESMPVAGEILITVPRNYEKKTPSRNAKLSIKYCPVTLKTPGRRKVSETLSNINLYAVLAEEVDPLDGITPIYWLLLTTLTVETLDQAIEKINWYKQRWKIERYHLTLKSGCKVEDLQLETKDRLENALAVYSIIAWKILWMRYEAEQNPDTCCEVVLQQPEWQALYCMVHQTPIPPKEPPTLKEAIILIAKLGGFLARKRDGEPGVTVIWRGMTRLNDIAKMWAILHHQHFASDVGND